VFVFRPGIVPPVGFPSRGNAHELLKGPNMGAIDLLKTQHNIIHKLME
jgi:hypothetical protein